MTTSLRLLRRLFSYSLFITVTRISSTLVNKSKNQEESRACRHTCYLALKTLRQKDGELEVSPGCTQRMSQKVKIKTARELN